MTMPATTTEPARCENEECQEILGEGAYQYRCDECNAPVCTACSEDGPANSVLCENCAPLANYTAGARARSIAAHKKRPNNPKAHPAFPHPVKIPFINWSNYGQKSSLGLVAAIIYHYDETARIYRPHSVFTATEATPEQRARHVGGRARRWYWDCWDFTYIEKTDYTYYHNSGGGSPYTGATYSARRYRTKSPQYYRPGLFGQSAIWWNPEIAGFRPDSSRGPDHLTPAQLRTWGWRVLPRPANLGAGLVDPFDSNGHYDSCEGSTTWCDACQARVPEEESETCEHGDEEKE